AASLDRDEFLYLERLALERFVERRARRHRDDHRALAGGLCFERARAILAARILRAEHRPVFRDAVAVRSERPIDRRVALELARARDQVRRVEVARRTDLRAIRARDRDARRLECLGLEIRLRA